jgi:hypothetical protein
LNGSQTWYGDVNEDGSFNILARVTAIEGSGTAVKPEEGNPLQQADVSTITCKVFTIASRDATTGTEVTPAPTLTPAANLYDALQTLGWPTGRDPHGYNFRLDLGPAYSASPAQWVLVEVKFTLSGGGVVWLKVRVKTKAVVTS